MRRRRGSTVTVSRTIEIDVEVKCEVTPGEKGHGPTYDSGGYPGSPPEATILGVWAEGLPETWDLTALLSAQDREAIEEAALEKAADDEVSAREAAAEAREDARRERRMFGED